MQKILETLEENGSLRTFLSLLVKTGVHETLKREGPFTLFAPNDEAFQRVQMESITKDPQYLTMLLEYHILEEKVSSAQVAERLELLTSNGKSLTVQLEEGIQVVDNARYVKKDIQCQNGVIHIMDNVFLPQFAGWYD